MTRVVTIDGPSGSGKGTIAALLAERLGWHCLDSGALYRLVGLIVDRAGIGFEKGNKIAELGRNMDVEFSPAGVMLEGEDVSIAIRTETAGNNASKVAAIPAVREALLQWQHDYAREPGLIADGRDMGSVVFPQAEVKIFLDASAEERAQRRYKQLKEKGLDVSLAGLVAEIEERDQRDRNRSVAPLKAPDGALVVDSTGLSIEEVLATVLEQVQCTFPDLEV
ncbi:MAG: (d)CMP kinase [Chromatiales bacterium]|nr:(d)CMP kinase [Chromatiales bacterium]